MHACAAGAVLLICAISALNLPAVATFLMVLPQMQYHTRRGLDNRVYYMLAPQGQYYNFSGCGNTFNCNHPVVQVFIQT